MEANTKVDIYKSGLEQTSKFTIILDNIIMAFWIALGTIACWFFYDIVAWIYLGFAIVMIYFVLRKMLCTRCYYYNKWCHIGWGKLSALLFKKGDIVEFNKCTGGKIAPLTYMTLTLTPIILLVISILIEFSFLKIIIILLFLVVSVYNLFISRIIACKKCKMRNICPGSTKKNKA